MDRRKILIVDDEEEFLRAMRIRLTSWGYDVASATNGKEALRLVESFSPDAVILDISMPEMDGIATLKRIRLIDKKVPVFMLTGYASEDKMQKVELLDVAAFIPKADEIEDASNMIRAVLHQMVPAEGTPFTNEG